MARRVRKPITLAEYEKAIGEFDEAKFVPFLPSPAGLAIETFYQLTTDDEISPFREAALQTLSKSGKVLLGDSRSAINEVIDVITGAKELSDLIDPREPEVPIPIPKRKKAVPRRPSQRRRLR